MDPWHLVADDDTKARDDAAVAAYLRKALVDAKVKNDTPSRVTQAPHGAAGSRSRCNHDCFESYYWRWPDDAILARKTSSCKQSHCGSGTDSESWPSLPAYKKSKLADGSTKADPYIATDGNGVSPIQGSPSTASLSTPPNGGHVITSSRRGGTLSVARTIPPSTTGTAMRPRSFKEGLNKCNNAAKETIDLHAMSPETAAPLACNLVDDDIESPMEAVDVNVLGNIE